MELRRYYSGILRGQRTRTSTLPTHAEALRDYDARARQMRQVADGRLFS